MDEIDALVGPEEVNESSAHVIFSLFFLTGIFIFFLVNIDQQILQTNQARFQRALSNGVKAYSTTYSTAPQDLSLLSEGYLTGEDIRVYSVKKNPVVVDRVAASNYLFKVLETSTEHSISYLKSTGIYIINIITIFNQPNPSAEAVPQYIVSIYKNGDIAQVVDVACNSLSEVQSLVENTLSVTIDIAVNYNASLRQAQKYKRETSTMGGSNPQKTYSTYTTNMAIVKNVPIKNLLGEQLVDVKEIQTYSVVRGDE